MGEFNLVSMKDLNLESGLLKTSFEFLTAKKKSKVDFITQDYFNEVYCVKYDCDEKKYIIEWCGAPH